MKNTAIKILFIIIGLLIVSSVFPASVEAEEASVFVSPASVDKKAGQDLDLSVKVEPAGQEVCAVEGELNLDGLSCEEVEMSDDVMSQTQPSCDDLSFLIGISSCVTSQETLFTVKTETEKEGTATADFSQVDIIGEGKSISSASAGGDYNVEASCSCGNWSSWKNQECGGGSCASDQRLQTRTRSCSPSNCNTELESKCIDDSSCVTTAQEKEKEKEIAKKSNTEEKVAEKENGSKATSEKVVEEKKKETKDYPERLSNRGGLAALSMTWQQIAQSGFLTIVVILCLLATGFITGRRWNEIKEKFEEMRE